MPSDNVVNYLPIGNITARDMFCPQQQIYLPRIEFGKSSHSENIDCYLDSIQFVILNYVESTLVGLCCETKSITQDQVTYPVLRSDRIAASWYKPAHKIETDVSMGHTLHFIDLHPQRRFVAVSLEESKLRDASDT